MTWAGDGSLQRMGVAEQMWYTGLGTGSTVMAGKHLFAHVAQSPIRKIAAVVVTRTHVS